MGYIVSVWGAYTWPPQNQLTSEAQQPWLAERQTRTAQAISDSMLSATEEEVERAVKAALDAEGFNWKYERSNNGYGTTTEYYTVVRSESEYAPTEAAYRHLLASLMPEDWEVVRKHRAIPPDHIKGEGSMYLVLKLVKSVSPMYIYGPELEVRVSDHPRDKSRERLYPLVADVKSAEWALIASRLRHYTEEYFRVEEKAVATFRTEGLYASEKVRESGKKGLAALAIAMPPTK